MIGQSGTAAVPGRRTFPGTGWWPGPSHLTSGGLIREVAIADGPVPHFFRIRS